MNEPVGHGRSIVALRAGFVLWWRLRLAPMFACTWLHLSSAGSTAEWLFISAGNNLMHDLPSCRQLPHGTVSAVSAYATWIGRGFDGRSSEHCGHARNLE